MQVAVDRIEARQLFQALLKFVGASLYPLFQLVVGLLEGAGVILPFDGVDQCVDQQAAGRLVLVEVVLGPGLDAGACQFRVLPPGQHDDRQVWIALPERLKGLAGLAVGEIEIGEHHVDRGLLSGRSGLQAGQPLVEAAHRLHREGGQIPPHPAALAQFLLDQQRVAGVILDGEDPDCAVIHGALPLQWEA